MTRRILFLPIAAAEIRTAYRWYERRRPGLGEEFLTQVRGSVAVMAERPERYRVVADPARRCLLRRFPYQLIFQILSDGDLRILALAHERREPLYWIGRLPA